MNTNILILILGMAIVTYIPRAMPAVLIDKMKFTPKAEKFLRLIPLDMANCIIGIEIRFNQRKIIYTAVYSAYSPSHRADI